MSIRTAQPGNSGDQRNDDPPLTTDRVLRDEIEAIYGDKLADDVAGEALYGELYKRNAAALCLSGGGVRSASFALGVIQALAAHSSQPPDRADASNSYLARFNYLSTVSGGGYIGSWLSAWLTRAGLPAVWAGLVGRPQGHDLEPPVISWLRAYSNFLTPQVGVMSADTWAAVAMLLRNMLLNWLVILPVLCLVLVGVKIYAMAIAWCSQLDPRSFWETGIAVAVGVGLLIAALAFIHGQRPAHCSSRADQRGFLMRGLLPAVLAGMAFSCALAMPHAHEWYDGKQWFSWSEPAVFWRGLLWGAVIYVVAWLIALPRWTMWDLVRGRPWKERADAVRAWRNWRDVRRDLLAVICAGAVFGTITALGVALYFSIWDKELPLVGRSEALLVVVATPWTLFAELLAETIFVGLSSYEKDSDSDREWLARASGWYIAAALAWLLVTTLVFLSASVAADIHRRISAWISGLGAGGIASWLAKSSATPAKGAVKNGAALSMNVVATILAIAFAVFLVVVTSALLDEALLGKVLIESAQFHGKVVIDGYPAWPGGRWLWIGLVVSAAVAGVTSYYVNINRFSLHALYRNRLIRAFLGASHADKRKPNPFTDFDSQDNMRLHELWPPREWWAELRGNYTQPFHVINMALNIVSTKRKAWQERKAESFTATPLHTGCACYGLSASRSGPPRAYGAYRPSTNYGDSEGISVGTAVAISGAAASPNMGYNSSPPLAFLMTMFNVRLGWWLGNPEKDKLIYASEGPRRAIQPLLAEMFGLTDDDSDYIYLSDGGHFENLALYEMVRRRCRLIVVSDGGCDPDFAFEDIGNAVRKIALDLGVNISFHGLTRLKCRAEESRLAQCCPHGEARDAGEPETPLHAIGAIDYGAGMTGTILYVKAAYHAAIVRNAGVRSYAIAHPAFPHETTGDQFFSESQFESYRALGYEVMGEILTQGAAILADPVEPTLDRIIEGLRGRIENDGVP